MFHNPKRLYQMSIWIKRISWLYFLNIAFFGFTIIQYFFSDGMYYYIEDLKIPDWAIPTAYISDFLGIIFTMIGYFLLLQILAAVIQYLLSYYEQLAARSG